MGSLRIIFVQYFTSTVTPLIPVDQANKQSIWLHFLGAKLE